jgi:hypothetical protein
MKVNRLPIVVIFLAAFFLPACGLSPATASEPTVDLVATNEVLSMQATIQQGILSTQTAVAVVPTLTPKPTVIPPTLTPSATFEPAPELNSTTLEKVLRAEGYKRYPFKEANTGETAFFWDNGSGITFNTYSESFSISFLNDANNPSSRAKLIDRALEIVGPLLTTRAVEELRQELYDYADRVITVSGDPIIIDYGMPPDLGKLMEFNGSDTSIQDGSNKLPVHTRLLFRQYFCDTTLYYYCFFYDMPSMTFSGEASLTIFDVLINYPKDGNSGSTG